jgi:hypothetical protein
MKRHALAYAALGWPVFPCAGKVPRTSHGCLDATVDIDTIEGWWSRWPNANLGIATGQNVTVVDLDDTYAKQAWFELVGRKLVTPVSKTSRGWHVWLAGSDLANSASRLAPHVDIRGRGGYVVAPPSLHPSGARYEWLVHPDDVELAPVPDVVLEKLAPRPVVRRAPTPVSVHDRYAQAALDREVDRVAHAAVGTRNHTLNSAAFSLAQLCATGVLDRDVAIRSLFDAACSSGLSETETLRTIASGMRGGSQKPRVAR